MCGIAAIFNYRTGEPIDHAELTTVRDYMTTRGPDGFGDWISADRRIGLAHRRLSIIDLSEAGAQPMKNHDGSLIITFNGEIYNYRQLRSELEAKGYQFQSTSDTEVLLHLYAADGESMVGKLRGMYAFAIWNERKKGLFLARDPYGIKPLYLADNGKTLRLASQVKALLAGGQVDTSVEPAGHVGFFLWGHVPSPYTLYRGIRGLPSGTTLWLDQSGHRREHQFCSIPQILAAAEAESAPSAIGHLPSSQSRLRSALTDSIRHHLVADVPVGIFLSSGLDSTSITALASECSSNLRTVTLAFEEFQDKPDDESPLAAEVAARYGARHQTVWVGKHDFRDSFDRIMQAMDQPSCDGINSFFVSHAAARAGLKVALSGLGGDELLGGYPSFGEIPRSVRLLKHFSASTLQPFNAAFRFLSAPMLRRFSSPKYASLFEHGGTYGGAYLLRRGMFMPWELPEVLDPNLVRQGWQELQTLARLEQTAAGLKSPFLKVGALETCWYMRNQLLRDTDWASMDHSIEVRTPLVDIGLLGNLAPLLAGDTPPTKRDVALSPISQLPSSVLNRPKTGFGIPVRQWLMDSQLSTLSAQHPERGLRGWTRLVYSQSLGACPRSPVVRRRGVPSPRGPVVAPKRVLVFRIGQLGDTIAALPAISAVRSHFPNGRFTLLCDRHPGKPFVFGPDLLRGSGLFDDFEFYPVHDQLLGRLLQAKDMLALLRRLRRARYDTLVYLLPSARTRRQVARDVRFFRAAGITEIIGTEGFAAPPVRTPGRPLDEVPHEAELLLARLAASEISVPPPGRGSMDLGLGPKEEAEVRAWLDSQTRCPVVRGPVPPVASGHRPWVGFGPGSKMPAKRWPWERFAELGRRLIEQFDIWPVVFGGAEDAADAARLLKAWGRGYNAAGGLSLRAAGAALRRCLLYVGNDTGTMHLAASVGTRCVAIFSARDWPGRWNPYGPGHRVLRAAIDCEGCGLVECLAQQNECLSRISVSEVLAACEPLLQEKLAHAEAPTPTC